MEKVDRFLEAVRKRGWPEEEMKRLRVNIVNALNRIDRKLAGIQAQISNIATWIEEEKENVRRLLQAYKKIESARGDIEYVAEHVLPEYRL